MLRVSAVDEWLTGIVLTRRWVTGIGPVSRTAFVAKPCSRADDAHGRKPIRYRSGAAARRLWIQLRVS